ncbi:MAG: anti-sigma factor [Acidimicrobiia bacterium]|nr:anti-sigma factor [Acidimicrobiia bacterium]
MRSRRFAVFAVAVGLVAAACGSSEPTTTIDSEAAGQVEDQAAPTVTPAPDPTSAPTPEPTPTAEPTPTPEPVPELTLDLPGLPALGAGAVYEAWLIADGTPVSAGTFDLVGGSTVQLPVVEESTASAVVITIETDDDPAPAATHVLAGSLVEGRATLTIADAAAIGADFEDASGQYILGTPTDGSGAPENERSGVWWTFIPRAQSLFLPELPDGWVYEGWQVIDGVPVSTGTFTTLFGAPDDAAPYSGPEAGPPFPGEDFLQNAPDGLTFPRDLRGTEVVISIEPVPDTDVAPFPLVPLRGFVADDASDHVHYSVDNVAADLPEGTATLG